MDKIRFDMNKNLFIVINATIVVNVICMVVQLFSLKRLRDAEEIYHMLALEELEMRADMKAERKQENRK